LIARGRMRREEKEEKGEVGRVKRKLKEWVTAKIVIFHSDLNMIDILASKAV